MKLPIVADTAIAPLIPSSFLSPSRFLVFFLFLPVVLLLIETQDASRLPIERRYVEYRGRRESMVG